MIRHLLTARNKFLGRSTRKFPQPRKFVGFLLPVKLLLFKKTDTIYYRSTLYLLDALVPLISLRSKFYFSLFLDMKIWASCACILNSKSAASGPIWLKFGQIVVRWVNYKTVSANCNFSFHFKVMAYSSLAVAIISHPQIYLLVKIKRTHFPEI